MNNLREKLLDLPNKSGVYMMKNQNGDIIYIGKAKVLRNRVKQYFAPPHTLQIKVRVMMSHVTDFSYIVTMSEVDALALESNLVKQHQPQYNIMLKDDKQFPFVKIQSNQDFPRVSITRKVEKDGAKYFGPILGSSKEFMNLIREVFPIVWCNQDFSKLPKNFRPCLNHHIEKCLAPCIGGVSKEEYAKIIERLVNFLKGDDKEVYAILTQKMQNASDNLDFENAMEIKTKLQLLDKLRDVKLSCLTQVVNYDIFSVCSDGTSTVVNTMLIRTGKIVYCQSQAVQDASFTEGQALLSFVSQYYQVNELSTSEIFLSHQSEDVDTVAEFLSKTAGKKISLSCPQRGTKAQLVKMSLENARDFLVKSNSRESRDQLQTAGAVTQLQQLLGLKNPPNRIECYDISNIQGVDKVASMVVFVGGKKQPKLYRRFKIKTVEGANDFASMAEVVSRRLKRLQPLDKEFGEKPDLIVVDGGLGQLGYASRQLAESNQDIEIVSLAKREEEVFTTRDNVPVILPKQSFALKLLINLRDEAHRFAITYFRSLHVQNALKSALRDIAGVGQKRQLAIFRKFKTISNIQQATVQQLAEVEGMTKGVAQKIFDHFHITGGKNNEEHNS